MNTLTRVIATIAVSTSLALSVTTPVFATRSYDDLAQKLASKFDLNSSEVEKFIVAYYAREDEDTSTMFADHLKFIEKKLAVGVKNGEITSQQKKAVMTKLKKMMDKGPSADAYRKMSDSELREKINAWKKEMTVWAKKNDMTLAQLRELTGKGNKYLMGVELD